MASDQHQFTAKLNKIVSIFFDFCRFLNVNPNILAPGQPTAVKALVMGSGAILVSWRPPAMPNGMITQYTVYIKSSNEKEAKSHKIPAYQMSYEASGLTQNQAYEFLVSANTVIGEGQMSNNVIAMPDDKVPAKIASFDDTFTATFKEDTKLPCLAVGSPTPDITWKVRRNNKKINMFETNSHSFH